jgi:hypothetical protein
MTGRVYLRAIVPIGVFFSLSLMFSNMTYIHLSVAFIQMLKVILPHFNSFPPQTNIFLSGHHSSRHSACNMGSWHSPSQSQDFG